MPRLGITAHDRLAGQSALGADSVRRLVDLPRQRLRAGQSESRRSAIESSITPPSEVRRPASNAAVTCFTRNGWKREWQEIIAGHGERGSEAKREGWCQQQNPTLYQRITPRSPASTPANGLTPTPFDARFATPICSKLHPAWPAEPALCAGHMSAILLLSPEEPSICRFATGSQS